jgi:hypothetical protein
MIYKLCKLPRAVSTLIQWASWEKLHRMFGRDVTWEFVHATAAPVPAVWTLSPSNKNDKPAVASASASTESLEDASPTATTDDDGQRKGYLSTAADGSDGSGTIAKASYDSIGATRDDEQEVANTARAGNCANDPDLNMLSSLGAATVASAASRSSSTLADASSPDDDSRKADNNKVNEAPRAATAPSNEADALLGTLLQHHSRYTIKHRQAREMFNSRVAETRAALLRHTLSVQQANLAARALPLALREDVGQQLDQPHHSPPAAPLSAHVHAECALLMHALAHSLALRKQAQPHPDQQRPERGGLAASTPVFRYTNYIGLNKPPCMCCARFLAAFNRACGTNWTVALRLPDKSEARRKTPKLREWGFALLPSLQQQARQHHAHGGGEQHDQRLAHDGSGSSTPSRSTAGLTHHKAKRKYATRADLDGNCAVVEALRRVHRRLAWGLRDMCKEVFDRWNRPDEEIEAEERNRAEYLAGAFGADRIQRWRTRLDMVLKKYTVRQAPVVENVDVETGREDSLAGGNCATGDAETVQNE